MDSGRYPMQSVWESLGESLLRAELDEVRSVIGAEMVDANQQLWDEFATLKSILKDVHAFNSKPETYEYPTSTLLDEASYGSPQENTPSLNIRFYEVILSFSRFMIFIRILATFC